MKKLILLLLIVGGTAYGATKFYLHSEVEDAMDMAVLMMSPYAKLTYGGVKSTITGELTIEDIRVDIQGYEDELLIDRVGIDTPSFLSLLDLGDLQAMQRSGMPKSIGLIVEGVRVPVDADYFNELYTATLDTRSADDADKVSAICTGKYGFSPAVLADLGYDEQVFSLVVTARNDKSHYSIDVTTSSADMWDIAATMNLAGDMTSEVMKGPAYRPRLRNMRFEYTDRSLNQRVQNYCAQRGLTADDIFKAQMDAFHYLGESNGVVFDEYMILPYQDFIAGKSTFIVTANPNEPIALSQIDLYKPEDVPALLNLEASTR